MAVGGLMTSPAGQLRRTTRAIPSEAVHDNPPWAAAARQPGLRGLLLGRADAAPLARRLVVSMVATLAIVIAIGARTLHGIGWALVPLLTAAGVVALGALEPRASRRRRDRLVMDTPAALELLAAVLAAGLPPRNATAAVVSAFDGPVAEDLASVLAAVDVGMSDALAWRHLRDHPTLGQAARDLARSVESGTMLVETLAHHAGAARQRRQGTVEAAAKAVGVRCVLPMMTCFIPAFLLLGIVPTVVSAFLAVLPAGLLGPYESPIPPPVAAANRPLLGWSPQLRSGSRRLPAQRCDGVGEGLVGLLPQRCV